MEIKCLLFGVLGMLWALFCWNRQYIFDGDSAVTSSANDMHQPLQSNNTTVPGTFHENEDTDPEDT